MKKQLLSYSLIGGGKSLVISLLCILFTTNLFAQDYDFKTTYNGVEMAFKITSSTPGEFGYPEVKLTKVDYRAESVMLEGTVTYNGKKYAITSIGKCAFWRDPEVSELNFEDRAYVKNLTFAAPCYIRSIGERAFYNCINLTEFTIWSNLQYIDPTAFQGSLIQKFYEYFECESPYKAMGGYLVDRATGTTVKMFAPWAMTVTLDSKVNRIASYAAASTTNSLSVTFTCEDWDNGVIIEGYAFDSSPLWKLTFDPDKTFINDIGQYAFNNCEKFTQLNLCNAGLRNTRFNEQAFGGRCGISVVETNGNAPNMYSLETTNIGTYETDKSNSYIQKPVMIIHSDEPNMINMYTKAYYGGFFKLFQAGSGLGSSNDEDVNNDGKVNATDAMQIYNYILSH